MSITTTTMGASPRTVKKQSGTVSLLLATLLALGSVFGIGSVANAAGESVSVQTYEVQRGSYQTFFVSGLAANTKYTAVLSRTNTSAAVAKKTFTTNASGNPTDSNLRMVVGTSAALASDYEVRLRLGTATTGTPLKTSSPSIKVIAPNTTAKITSVKVNAAKTKVTVVGEGFRRTNTAYNSVIGVKLDNGVIKHADTGTDKAPVPKPYPAAGSSPADVWFYIGKGNPGATGTDASYNGTSGFPNATYKSSDIVGGSFTVDIPIGSVPSGTHTLRFLTGSLWNTPWQSTGGADVPRSVTVNFTK
ncbi:MAG: hypothetical protein U0P48_11070 [Ancrocorticia sp.]